MSGSARIVIIAALAREVRGLVRGTAADPKLRRRGIQFYSLPSATVVAAGMGAARASLAFEAALAVGRPELVLSVGLAGSCSAELRPGAVVEAGAVVDVRTGERFACAGPEGPLLASAQAIASVAVKARVAASYGAAMVDMEAATVARLAQAHGLAFRAIKGVSDAHDFELASLARFATPEGQFRTGAFALHTALRPGSWSAAVQLGRESGKALEALQVHLRDLMAAF